MSALVQHGAYPLILLPKANLLNIQFLNLQFIPGNLIASFAQFLLILIATVIERSLECPNLLLYSILVTPFLQPLILVLQLPVLLVQQVDLMLVVCHIGLGLHC